MRFLIQMFLVAIAIFLSVSLFSIANGDYSIYRIYNFSLIGGGKSYIPLLIYLLTFDYLIRFPLSKYDLYDYFWRQFLVGIVLMAIGISIFTGFDWFLNPAKVRGLHYLRNYSLSMVYCPIVLVLNYLMNKEKVQAKK